MFDRDERVFGYGFNIRYQVLNTFDHYLYGKSLNGRELKTLWPDQQIPFFVTAMALADNMLFLAGPPTVWAGVLQCSIIKETCDGDSE